MGVSVFILTLVLSSVFAANPVMAGDNRIEVTVAPSTLIADGESHQCVFVQLQNSKDDPMQAPGDVLVTLTSSNLGVGSVTGSIIIPEGGNFGRAEFKTTKYAGQSIITASAQGYFTGNAEVSTIQPLTEAQLKVYALPSVVPAVAGQVGKVFIQLIDVNGVPFPSTESLLVTITASNSTVLTIAPSAVIAAGSSYATVDFTATGRSGDSTISVLTQGLKPGEAYLRFEKPTTVGKQLRLELGPTVLLPDGSAHRSVMVSILDKNGYPVKVGGDYVVHLSSSNTRVAGVTESVTIAKDTYLASAQVESRASGSSVIAASAEGLLSDTQTLTIDGSIPRTLSVKITPSSVIADSQTNPIVTMQVMDQNGLPVYLDRTVNLFISTSNPSVGTIVQAATLLQGANYAQIVFEPASTTGTTIISVSSGGLESNADMLKTTILLMNATITVPRPTALNDKLSSFVTITSLGAPVKGGSVTWSVLGGTVDSQEATTDANGISRATITQASESSRIRVQISKPGYKATEIVRMSVIPIQESTELTVDILGYKVPLFNLMLVIGVVIVVVFAVYIYFKYRKGKTDRLEVVG